MIMSADKRQYFCYTKSPLLLLLLCLVFQGCGEGSGAGGASQSGSGTSVSQSGSTAAMATYENAIYTLINGVVIVTDLESEKSSNRYSFGDPFAETLYVYRNYLYVAGLLDVAIYDISEPLIPERVSNYDHARACDPVIVSNDIGYITLRSRPECTLDEINRLEVVDFSDPENPVQLARFVMDFPHGLAKSPDHLAVCQEEFGLTFLNVDDIDSIEVTLQDETYNCFDLFYRDDTFFVTATDGIYQLELIDNTLNQISRIPVGSSATPL